MDANSNNSNKNPLVVRTTKQTFVNVFKSINAVTQEVSIVAKADSLGGRCWDPAHITLLDINFQKSDFELYEFNYEGDLKFGCRADDISKALPRLGKKDTDPITMTVTSDSMLKFESGDRFFKFKLIEASAAEIPLPKIPFTCKAEIPHAYFKEVLDSVVIIDNTVQLVGDDKEKVIKIAASDNSKGDFEEIVRTSSEASLMPTKVEVNEPGSARFNMAYVNAVAKAVSIDKVVINFRDQAPALFQYGRISYWVAPKVQE